MSLSPVNEWFKVNFDDDVVKMQICPSGKPERNQKFRWTDVIRVCFKAEGLELSDAIYIFTNERPESYVIPMEAEGGGEFWNRILLKGLFDAELAIEAATSLDGLFCWPPIE